MQSSKCKYIDNINLPLLERLNIFPENWLKFSTQFTRVFYGALDRPNSQTSYCENLNKKWRANISNTNSIKYVI